MKGAARRRRSRRRSVRHAPANSSITFATDVSDSDHQQAASARFRQHGKRDEAVRSQQAGHQHHALPKRSTIRATAARCFSRGRRRAPPLSPQATQDVDAFQAAVTRQTLLPDGTGQRVGICSTNCAPNLPPEQMFLQENALRVALEDQAQQVLLALSGGRPDRRRRRAEFDAGSQYMEAAMKLTPESLYLEGRDSFFQGRALLFEKQYRPGGGSAGAVGPHRSGRGLRLQRAGHRVSGTGRFRESDSGVPRCRAPRSELVLSAAQSGAGLCRSGRLPRAPSAATSRP